MSNPLGDYYKLVKSVFQAYSENPEQGLSASLTENADTLTLQLTVKHEKDELQFYYIFGNNPLSVMFNGEVKIFTASHEQLFDKVVYIAHEWKRTKNI